MFCNRITKQSPLPCYSFQCRMYVVQFSAELAAIPSDMISHRTHTWFKVVTVDVDLLLVL